MISVIPAIIPKDFEDLRTHVEQVRNLVSSVQVDIIDGVYAPTRTWPFVGGYSEFENIISGEEGLPFWRDISYEVDLMVTNPEQEIEKWFRAGVSTLIIHAGSTKRLKDIREKLSEWDIEMGIAFKPSEDIPDELIELADFIQIMGNDKIGYHGVDLDPFVYEKISTLHKKYPDRTIAIDIGVDMDTAPLLIKAGVTKLVSGSALFGSDNISEAIETLKHA